MSAHNYVVMEGELHRIVGETTIKGEHYYITQEETGLFLEEVYNANHGVDEEPLASETGLPTRALLFRVDEVSVFHLVAAS